MPRLHSKLIKTKSLWVGPRQYNCLKPPPVISNMKPELKSTGIRVNSFLLHKRNQPYCSGSPKHKRTHTKSLPVPCGPRTSAISMIMGACQIGRVSGWLAEPSEHRQHLPIKSAILCEHHSWYPKVIPVVKPKSTGQRSP